MNSFQKHGLELARKPIRARRGRPAPQVGGKPKGFADGGVVSAVKSLFKPKETLMEETERQLSERKAREAAPKVEPVKEPGDTTNRRKSLDAAIDRAS